MTLPALHQAILTAIVQRFPEFDLVEFYREERKGLPQCSCLLELSEFEGDEENDPGTEQLSVEGRFEARIVVDFGVPDAKLYVRDLAATMAAWLHRRRWPGAITGPARVLGAYRDEFHARLDEYEVWRVEWRQAFDLGESVFAGDRDGITPTPLFAWSPRVGIPHQQEYESLAGQVMPKGGA